jgi:hypothetical protein
MTIGGSIGAAADEEKERCRVIAKVESSRRELSSILFAIRPRHFESALFEADKDSHAPIRHNGGMTDDDIIQLIETFNFDAGPVAGERRNRGFTLIHAETGVPIARLRPIGRDDLVDVLYWSLWKERWMPFGPFGRTAAPVEQAVRIIAEASIFWAGV